ncbi:MAG: RNA polymerase sigma factor [Gammaproteobacteria bacterium]
MNIKDIVAPPAEVSDEDIIKRIKKGDGNAYGGIMRRYNHRIYRIARSIVTDNDAAMDVVQEAHIKAYTRLESFQGSSSFIAWLASITRNEALMYLRKHKREVSMSDDEIETFERSRKEKTSLENEDHPDAHLENKQLQKLIDQNIDTLPEGFRTVFILRAIEQFSVKETAEILNINQATVKTRYFRARKLLRGQIQTYLDTAGITIYEFGGDHCDIIVKNVMDFINKNVE